MPDQRSVDNRRIGDVAVSAELRHRRDESRFQGPWRRALRFFAVLSGDIGAIKIPLIPAVASGLLYAALSFLMTDAFGWKFQSNQTMAMVVSGVELVIWVLIIYALGKAVGGLDPKDKPNILDMLILFASFAPVILGLYNRSWLILGLGLLIVVLVQFGWTRVATGDTQISVIYVSLLLAFVVLVSGYAYFGTLIAKGVGGGGWGLGSIDVGAENVKLDDAAKAAARQQLCQQGQLEYCAPQMPLPTFPTELVPQGMDQDKALSLWQKFCQDKKVPPELSQMIPTGFQGMIQGILGGSSAQGLADKYCQQWQTYQQQGGTSGTSFFPTGPGTTSQGATISDATAGDLARYYCTSGGRLPSGWGDNLTGADIALINAKAKEICPNGPSSTVPSTNSSEQNPAAPTVKSQPNPTPPKCAEGWYWSNIAKECKRK